MAARLVILAARPLLNWRRLLGVPDRGLPRFTRMSNATRDFAGSPAFSALLLLGVIAWSAAGPILDYSRAWELTATTGAPIVALVLLVVIQHTQNRDGRAIQLKLDEVIRASEHASDALIGIEEGPDIELTRLLSDYRRHTGVNRPLPTPEAAPAGEGRFRRQQQRRRFADGDLGPEQSFVFRSPAGTLNVQAQNLVLFVHLAETVDDDTWFDHLRRGDYSRWFRNVIRDESLAREAARLEGPDDGRPTADSRRRIISAIVRRYPVSD